MSPLRYLPVSIDARPGASLRARPGGLREGGAASSSPPGRCAKLTDKTVLISQDRAKKQQLSVGGTVQGDVAGQQGDYTVGGIFVASASVPNSILISLDTAKAAGLPDRDSVAFVVRDAGADPAAVEAAIEKVIADVPTVTLKDQDAFAAEQRAPIDQLLYIIYALLGLAVIIAILGIIDALALSVIERTREIGLLRAVGLSGRS